MVPGAMTRRGGPALRGLGDNSWEQPGHMHKELNEEAFGLSKEGLGAGEEERWGVVFGGEIWRIQSSFF